MSVLVALNAGGMALGISFLNDALKRTACLYRSLAHVCTKSSIYEHIGA